MKKRCYNENDVSYKNYGGKGITVCDEWIENPKSFISWAINNGYSEGLQIDRIDTFGNYEPSNCRFVTQKQNCNNRRNSKKVTAFGETKSLEDWANDKRCLVSYSVLQRRISQNGMNPEIAISNKAHSLGTSKYVGVSYVKAKKKYLAQLIINNKNIFIGYFFSERSAAAAYNVYSYSRLGDSGFMNDLREI